GHYLIAYSLFSVITYSTPLATTGVARTGSPMSISATISFFFPCLKMVMMPLSLPKYTLPSTQYGELHVEAWKLCSQYFCPVRASRQWTYPASSPVYRMPSLIEQVDRVRPNR